MKNFLTTMSVTLLSYFCIDVTSTRIDAANITQQPQQIDQEAIQLTIDGYVYDIKSTQILKKYIDVSISSIFSVIVDCQNYYKQKYYRNNSSQNKNQSDPYEIVYLIRYGSSILLKSKFLDEVYVKSNNKRGKYRPLNNYLQKLSQKNRNPDYVLLDKPSINLNSIVNSNNSQKDTMQDKIQAFGNVSKLLFLNQKITGLSRSVIFDVEYYLYDTPWYDKNYLNTHVDYVFSRLFSGHDNDIKKLGASINEILFLLDLVYEEFMEGYEMLDMGVKSHMNQESSHQYQAQLSQSGEELTDFKRRLSEIKQKTTNFSEENIKEIIKILLPLIHDMCSFTSQTSVMIAKHIYDIADKNKHTTAGNDTIITMIKQDEQNHKDNLKFFIDKNQHMSYSIITYIV